jgi:hypothetical protein
MSNLIEEPVVSFAQSTPSFALASRVAVVKFDSSINFSLSGNNNYTFVVAEKVAAPRSLTSVRFYSPKFENSGAGNAEAEVGPTQVWIG